MTAITFDTLKFMHRLRDSGIPEQHAEAIAEAFKEASGEADLVSKKDLQIELAPIKADISLIKWMLGILLAGVMSLILKAFF
jgi:hypothetical protein